MTTVQERDEAAVWRCMECKTWEGTVSMMEKLPNTKHDIVYLVCPYCGAADHFDLICDEPGCGVVVSCGWPSPEGYRRTCGKHYHMKKV